MRQTLARLVLSAAVLATPALADDPKDPAMRTAAARARDREMTRQLNLGQLAYVRQRDAGYAAGWAATRATGYPAEADPTYSAEVGEHRRAMDRYAADRADYERCLAQWRRQADDCRNGNWDACR